MFYCVFSVDDDVSPSDEDPGNSAGKGWFNNCELSSFQNSMMSPELKEANQMLSLQTGLQILK